VGFSDKSVIVFVEHHDYPRDDRAWEYVGALGFVRRLVCPFRGEPLGIPGPEVAGTVIYGGGQNVSEQEKYPFLTEELYWIEACLSRDIPSLGLCLGGQLMAHALGAQVRRRQPEECEFGCYPLYPTETGQDWIPAGFHGTEAHYEEFDIPADAVHLASSERFPNQAFRYGDRHFGLQFHPEINRRIFYRWQLADWAMYQVPGAQDRAEQSRLLSLHDELQGRWFRQFLEELFRQPDSVHGSG
jgi:GMP synthase (glutamine-hydrolysing)